MKNFCYYLDLVVSRIIPGALIALLFFPQGRTFTVFFLLLVYLLLFIASWLLARKIRGRIYRAYYTSGIWRIYPNGFGSEKSISFPYSCLRGKSVVRIINMIWHLKEGEKKFWHFPGANKFFRREWEGRIAKLKTKTMSKTDILANPDNLRDILFLVAPRENYQPYFCETLAIVGENSSFELQKSSFESQLLDEESGAEWTQGKKYLLVRKDFSVAESTEGKSLSEIGITSEDVGIFEVTTTSQSENWASHPSFGYYARFQPL